jgi:hypothetical protein
MEDMEMLSSRRKGITQAQCRKAGGETRQSHLPKHTAQQREMPSSQAAMA